MCYMMCMLLHERFIPSRLSFYTRSISSVAWFFDSAAHIPCPCTSHNPQMIERAEKKAKEEIDAATRALTDAKAEAAALQRRAEQVCAQIMRILLLTQVKSQDSISAGVSCLPSADAGAGHTSIGLLSDTF